MEGLLILGAGTQHKPDRAFYNLRAAKSVDCRSKTSIDELRGVLSDAHIVGLVELVYGDVESDEKHNVDPRVPRFRELAGKKNRSEGKLTLAENITTFNGTVII